MSILWQNSQMKLQPRVWSLLIIRKWNVVDREDLSVKRQNKTWKELNGYILIILIVRMNIKNLVLYVSYIALMSERGVRNMYLRSFSLFYSRIPSLFYTFVKFRFCSFLSSVWFFSCYFFDRTIFPKFDYLCSIGQSKGACVCFRLLVQKIE